MCRCWFDFCVYFMHNFFYWIRLRFDTSTQTYAHVTNYNVFNWGRTEIIQVSVSRIYKLIVRYYKVTKFMEHPLSKKLWNSHLKGHEKQEIAYLFYLFDQQSCCWPSLLVFIPNRPETVVKTVKSLRCLPPYDEARKPADGACTVLHF